MQDGNAGPGMQGNAGRGNAGRGMQVERYVDMIPIAAILAARRRHGLLVWG
jgi:hypothetical protein